VLPTAQRYIPSTESLLDLEELSSPRADHSSTLLSDGQVLIAGGTDGWLTLQALEAFDPVTGSFTLLDLELLTPREGHRATALPDGRVLIEGGWNTQGELETAEIIDLTAGTVVPAADLEALVFPTLTTDKMDYIPGETVTVTGTGWQSGETVALLFDENPLQHAPRVLTAIADGNGAVLNASFEVEEHHVGTKFALHGTGLSSGWSAQTHFTDGSILEITAIDVISPAGATDEGVSTEQSFVVEVSLKNRTTAGPNTPEFNQVTVTLTPPTGFTRISSNPATFTLAAGATTTKSWTVEAPSTASSGDIAIALSGTPSSGVCGVGAIDCDDAGTLAVSAVLKASLSVTSLSATPALRKAGETVTVSMTVANGSSRATAKSVTPGTLGVSATGTAAASCGSGGSAVDIAGGSSTTFNWSCTVSGNGMLTFSASASGTDENRNGSGDPTVSVGPSSPGAVTVDSTGPVLSLPSNITAQASGAGTAVVTWSASATDAVDGSVTLTCTPASGATFSLCTTSVGCSASDLAGNVSSGGFTVTVVNTYYRDLDADGYGDPATTQQACSQPTGYVSNSTDCNDGSSSIHPGATETCNGVDDDCDSQTDEGVTLTFYQDTDSDGHGNGSSSVQTCSTPTGAGRPSSAHFSLHSSATASSSGGTWSTGIPNVTSHSPDKPRPGIVRRLSRRSQTCWSHCDGKSGFHDFPRTPPSRRCEGKSLPSFRHGSGPPDPGHRTLPEHGETRA